MENKLQKSEVTKPTKDKEKFVTLFHGTTEASAKSILKTGLNPKSFLTNSRNVAFDAAVQSFGDAGGVVLKVKVLKSDLRKFRQVGSTKNRKVETGITSFAQVEEYKEKILSQGVSKFYTIYITVKPTNVIDDRENITFNYSSVLELKI